MTNNHDKTVKELLKQIKEQKVVFIDQYGYEHNVYSNGDNESIIRESVWFKEYKYPSMCNPSFPCQMISDDFDPLCEFKLNDKTMMESKSCKGCLRYNGGDLETYTKFLGKHTIIPDMAVVKDAKYTYWLELVNGHACSDYKFYEIKKLGIDVLEFHISDIRYEKDMVIIPCFNLKYMSKDEYNIVKTYYKTRKTKRKGTLLDGVLLGLFQSKFNNKLDLLNDILKLDNKRFGMVCNNFSGMSKVA